MKYRVVPTVWPVAGRAFRRGDTVTSDQVGPNVGSYLRLGLIEPIKAGSKKELVTEAETLGIVVPKGATKLQVAELIAKES